MVSNRRLYAVSDLFIQRDMPLVGSLFINHPRVCIFLHNFRIGQAMQWKMRDFGTKVWDLFLSGNDQHVH